MKKNKEKGYVYLIGNWDTPNIYKIGMTRGSVKKRIKELQTGNPSEMYTVKYHETKYPFFLERQLHFRLREGHITGEWFELKPIEVASFEIICQNIEKMIEEMKDNPFFRKNLK